LIDVCAEPHSKLAVHIIVQMTCDRSQADGRTVGKMTNLDFIHLSLHVW